MSRQIDNLSRGAAVVALWLVLICALVSAGNALSRYAFDLSSNPWLELQWYMFAAVFMGCAGYALLRKEHIRIDIIANHLSERANQRIALFGHVFFLVPLCLIMIYFCWPYFLESVRVNEHSSNAGGLVRWPVKLMMVVGFALLLMQGISEIIKRIAFLRGLITMDTHYERPLQ